MGRANRMRAVPQRIVLSNVSALIAFGMTSERSSAVGLRSGTVRPAPASGTTTGMQIGQNSRAGDGLPPNEPLVGAIDRVRLFTEIQ